MHADARDLAVSRVHAMEAAISTERRDDDEKRTRGEG